MTRALLDVEAELVAAGAGAWHEAKTRKDIATKTADPDLCRVCIRRPATAHGVCDDCRPPWHTDEPSWCTRCNPG